MEITQRIRLLLSEMNRGVYEKETEINLSLLAALAGESILLLGPPGVAKSMVARRLKSAFTDARAFEYLREILIKIHYLWKTNTHRHAHTRCDLLSFPISITISTWRQIVPR